MWNCCLHFLISFGVLFKAFITTFPLGEYGVFCRLLTFVVTFCTLKKKKKIHGMDAKKWIKMQKLKRKLAVWQQGWISLFFTDLTVIFKQLDRPNNYDPRNSLFNLKK